MTCLPFDSNGEVEKEPIEASKHEVIQPPTSNVDSLCKMHEDEAEDFDAVLSAQKANTQNSKPACIDKTLKTALMKKMN